MTGTETNSDEESGGGFPASGAALLISRFAGRSGKKTVGDSSLEVAYLRDYLGRNTSQEFRLSGASYDGMGETRKEVSELWRQLYEVSDPVEIESEQFQV